MIQHPPQCDAAMLRTNNPHIRLKTSELSQDAQNAFGNTDANGFVTLSLVHDWMEDSKSILYRYDIPTVQAIPTTQNDMDIDMDSGDKCHYILLTLDSINGPDDCHSEPGGDVTAGTSADACVEVRIIPFGSDFDLVGSDQCDIPKSIKTALGLETFQKKKMGPSVFPYLDPNNSELFLKKNIRESCEQVLSHTLARNKSIGTSDTSLGNSLSAKYALSPRLRDPSFAAFSGVQPSAWSLHKIWLSSRLENLELEGAQLDLLLKDNVIRFLDVATAMLRYLSDAVARTRNALELAYGFRIGRGIFRIDITRLSAYLAQSTGLVQYFSHSELGHRTEIHAKKDSFSMRWIWKDLGEEIWPATPRFLFTKVSTKAEVKKAIDLVASFDYEESENPTEVSISDTIWDRLNHLNYHGEVRKMGNTAPCQRKVLAKVLRNFADQEIAKKASKNQGLNSSESVDSSTTNSLDVKNPSLSGMLSSVIEGAGAIFSSIANLANPFSPSDIWEDLLKSGDPNPVQTGPRGNGTLGQQLQPYQQLNLQP